MVEISWILNQQTSPTLRHSKCPEDFSNFSSRLLPGLLHCEVLGSQRDKGWSEIGPGQQGQPAGAPVEGEGGSHHLVPLPETGWDCHCFVRIQRGFIQAKPLTSIYFSLNLCKYIEELASPLLCIFG